MDAISRVKKLIEYRYLLIGMLFSKLDNDEKKVLYASELYDDCKDLQITADSVLDAAPEYIDNQLRVAFGYKDDTKLP